MCLLLNARLLVWTTRTAHASPAQSYFCTSLCDVNTSVSVLAAAIGFAQSRTNQGAVRPSSHKRHGLLQHPSTIRALAAGKPRRERGTIVLAQPWRFAPPRLAPPGATFGSQLGAEHEPETLHPGLQGRTQAPHPVRSFRDCSKGKHSVDVMHIRARATCSLLRHRRPTA